MRFEDAFTALNCIFEVLTFKTDSITVKMHCGVVIACGKLFKNTLHSRK